VHLECTNKSDNNKNTGNWNHLKITQKIPEQHTERAQNQGTTENSHTGHCTHTSESSDVKVRNVKRGEVALRAPLNCNYGMAATLYTLETLCIKYITLNTLHNGDNRQEEESYSTICGTQCSGETWEGREAYYSHQQRAEAKMHRYFLHFPTHLQDVVLN
jgi:hypothetical protein